MHSRTLHAFSSELQKTALNVSTLQSYLGARAAQGVGGAAALGKSLAGSPAQTTRQAVAGMTGLQKHRLGAVAAGGQAVRQMQSLPAKVGLQEATQATRQRVSQAIQHEAATGTSRQGGAPLSKAYEGYMSASNRSYAPAHVEHVMGLPAGSHQVRQGPTALMKPPQASAVDATVPAASGVRPTFRPAPAIDPHAVTQVVQPNTVVTTMPKRPRLLPAQQVANG